jgi:hypothetical protein
MSRKLLVTHHAPDLDAIGAVWLFKRFDAQHFADAKVAFVNPGETITLEQAEEFGCQLHEVTHVDTGMGEFDHHQPERGELHICASSLVYDHVCNIHPDLKNDAALKLLVEYITDTDHFDEVFWPEAGEYRSNLILHELVKGPEHVDPHDDLSQLHFGMQCLDASLGNLREYVSALEILESRGQEFTLAGKKCLAIETHNDATIKIAQKKGFAMVVRKDQDAGNIRIKARPDAPFDLRDVAPKVMEADPKATWFAHGSGKMLINGSKKHRNQVPSKLSIDQTIALLKEAYDR